MPSPACCCCYAKQVYRKPSHCSAGVCWIFFQNPPLFAHFQISPSLQRFQLPAKLDYITSVLFTDDSRYRHWERFELSSLPHFRHTWEIRVIKRPVMMRHHLISAISQSANSGVSSSGPRRLMAVPGDRMKLLNGLSIQQGLRLSPPAALSLDVTLMYESPHPPWQPGSALS